MPASASHPLFATWLAGCAASIERMADLKAAPALAARLREQQLGLVGAGLSGERATRLVSEINDRFSTRIIALTARRHRLPPTAWCWLALGSEGRHEQTLVSDQDNGLVFAASDAAEAAAMRELFVPFAREANQRLAACGFSMCPGDIMAGNPAWCLSFDEWRERFIDWVRRPHPEALLNATIFFDLRPLHGDAALGERLQDILLALSSDTPAFLHLMAGNALAAHPPLGLLGDVSLDEAQPIDLKKFGSRIFVDVARIFALASARRPVNSFARLSEAGPASGMQAEEISAARAALSHLLRLRLENQAAGGDGHAIRPADLNEIDRAILRESLRQARRLQQRLKLNYSL